MTNRKYFDSDDSNKLWDRYFQKVDRLLTKIPNEQGKVIRGELESHVFEAVKLQTVGTDFEKLERVLDNLGKPEDIVPPMAAAAFVEVTRRLVNPLDVLRVAFAKFGHGIANILRSISIMTMGIVGFISGAMALLKPFAPDHVGLFSNDAGFVAFGIIKGTENLTELLGYSIIPIGIVLSIILFKLSKLMLQYSKQT